MKYDDLNKSDMQFLEALKKNGWKATTTEINNSTSLNNNKINYRRKYKFNKDYSDSAYDWVEDEFDMDNGDEDSGNGIPPSKIYVVDKDSVKEALAERDAGEEFDDIQDALEYFDERLSDVDEQTSELQEQLDGLRKRSDNMDNQLEQRIDEIEQRLDELDEELQDSKARTNTLVSGLLELIGEDDNSLKQVIQKRKEKRR